MAKRTSWLASVANGIAGLAKKDADLRRRSSKPAKLGRLQTIVASPPMDLAVRQASQRNNRARRSLPSRSDLSTKLKKGVTASEFRRLYKSSNDADRERLEAYARRASKSWATVLAKDEARRRSLAVRLIRKGALSQRDAEYLTSRPSASPGRDEGPKVAGVKLGGAESAVKDVGKVLGANVVAAVTDPEHYVPNTAKGGARLALSSVAGLGQAAVDAVTRPQIYGTFNAQQKSNTYLEDIATDLRRRYGGSWRQTLKRVTKEGGAADLADLATIVSVGGAGVGRALGAASKAGKLGDAAKAVMEEPRPRLRTGNVADEQVVSPNYLRARLQRAQDHSRTKTMLRHARKSSDGIDASVEEALRRGQVVRRLGRDRAVRRQTSRLEGVTRLEYRHALANTLKPFRDAERKLSKAERPALKYAVQYGIRTPEQARVVLQRLLQQWEAHRTTLNRGPTSRFDADEIPIVRDLLADPARAFTPSVARLADEAARTGRRAALVDPRLTSDAALARARAPQGALLGLKRVAHDVADTLTGAVPELVHGGTESGVEFAKRVRAARATDPELAGLKPGAYWPSEKRSFAKFANYTRGPATRQLRGHERYTGILRDLGLEHGGTEAFDQAIAKNFRLAYNRDTVARVVQTQAFPWSLTRRGRVGLSARQIERIADEHGIDRKSYEIIHPGVYDRELSRRLQDQRGQASSADVLGTDPYQGVSAARDALIHASDRRYANVSGAVAIPRRAYDELVANATPSGRGARMVDKMRGASSMAVLGLNPTWPVFSAAGGALQSTIAGVPPWRLVGGKRVWNALSDTEKQQINARLGIGHHETYNTTRLGSQAPSWAREVVAWRNSLRGIPDKALTIANIPKHLFHVDARVQDALRRGLATHEAKRHALERMNRLAADGSKQLGALARLPPEDLAKALKDPRVIDSVAKKANDFLGDFTSYTARERAGLLRYTMFYGWLRFSTKFLFQTMPTQRPLVAVALAQLGQLHSTEVRRLMGGDENTSAFGKVFFPGDKVVNFARLNPLVNALSSEDAVTNPARTAVGLLPPPAQWAANQVANETVFTGKDWLLNGESTASKSKAANWRVLLADALKTVPLYRAADDIVTQGRPQGADSILGDRPTHYKRPDIVRSIKRDVRNRSAVPLWQQALAAVLPLPQPSKDRVIAESIRRNNLTAKRKATSVSRKNWGSGWGSGSSGGSWGSSWK